MNRNLHVRMIDDRLVGLNIESKSADNPVVLLFRDRDCSWFVVSIF